MMRKISKFSVVLTLMTSLLWSGCINLKVVRGDGKRLNKTYALANFTAIKINGTYNVTLVQGNTNEVRVVGDGNIIPIVKVESKDNVLNISTSQPFLSDSGINIFVTFSELKNITISGAMILNSQQKLAFDKLTLTDDGASIVNLEMNCVALTLESKGNTTYNLSGATVDLNVDISGSSVLNSKNLLADKAIITTDGSTVCNVNVLTSIDVTAKGTSEVNYYGTPEVSIKKGNTAYVNKVFYE
jgi:hypothetical protein